MIICLEFVISRFSNSGPKLQLRELWFIDFIMYM